MHVEGQGSPIDSAQTNSIHLCSRAIGGGAARAATKSGVVPCYVYTQVYTYARVHAPA